MLHISLRVLGRLVWSSADLSEPFGVLDMYFELLGAKVCLLLRGRV